MKWQQGVLARVVLMQWAGCHVALVVASECSSLKTCCEKACRSRFPGLVPDQCACAYGCIYGDDNWDGILLCDRKCDDDNECACGASGAFCAGVVGSGCNRCNAVDPLATGMHMCPNMACDVNHTKNLNTGDLNLVDCECECEHPCLVGTKLHAKCASSADEDVDGASCGKFTGASISGLLQEFGTHHGDTGIAESAGCAAGKALSSNVGIATEGALAATGIAAAIPGGIACAAATGVAEVCFATVGWAVEKYLVPQWCAEHDKASDSLVRSMSRELLESSRVKFDEPGFYSTPYKSTCTDFPSVGWCTNRFITGYRVPADFEDKTFADKRMTAAFNMWWRFVNNHEAMKQLASNIVCNHVLKELVCMQSFPPCTESDASACSDVCQHLQDCYKTLFPHSLKSVVHTCEQHCNPHVSRNSEKFSDDLGAMFAASGRLGLLGAAVTLAVTLAASSLAVACRRRHPRQASRLRVAQTSIMAEELESE